MLADAPSVEMCLCQVTGYGCLLRMMEGMGGAGSFGFAKWWFVRGAKPNVPALLQVRG